MDIGKTTYGIVALLIAVLVIGLVAVPVVEDASTGTKYTGKNTNYTDTYTYLDSSPSFSWSRGADFKMTLTVNGVARDVAYGQNEEIFVATDDFAIRAVWSGAQLWNYKTSTYELVLENTVTINLVVNNGAYTLTFNGTEYTGTITWALMKDPQGDWGIFSSPFRATVGQDVLIGHLYTSDYGPMNLATAKNGAITGFLVEPYNYSGTSIVAAEATYSNIAYSTQGEGQIVGSYSEMTLNWGENSSSDHFRAWAPLDYESRASGESGGTNTVLLSLIPLLLIIVAVVVAARLVTNG